MNQVFRLPFFCFVNYKQGKSCTENPESLLCKIKRVSRVAHLEDVCFSKEWSLKDLEFCQSELSGLLEKSSPEEIDHFLKRGIQWAYENENEAFFSFLAKLVTLDQLESLAKQKTAHDPVPFVSVDSWAELHLGFSRPKETYKISVKSDLRRYRSLCLYFIPNLINLCLSTLNLMDHQRKFTTLWDKYLIFEIICKIFQLPFWIISQLNPILVVPAKVYTVASVIISGLAVTVFAYQRWLRPLPDQLLYCQNEREKIDSGSIDLKVGQAKWLNQLFEALMGTGNVLLVGNSGVGKTTLFHHYAQLKKAGKLPEHLQELRDFSLDSGHLIGSASWGHAEMIQQVKDQIEGYEDQVLIYFDEINQIVSNPACFHSLKMRFLEDKPSPSFIGATTFEEFKKIKQLFSDGSFKRRVIPIIIEDCSDKELEIILKNFLVKQKFNIPFKASAIKKAVKLSKNDKDDMGRAAKALRWMEMALGRCRLVFDKNYVSPKLLELQESLGSIGVQGLLEEPSRKLLKKSQNIQSRLNTLVKEEQQDKSQKFRIQALVKRKLKIQADYDIFLEQSIHSKSEISKKLFLLLHFYGKGMIQNLLDSAVNSLKGKMAVQIDGDLIEQVYQDLKTREEKCYGPANRSSSS